MNTLKTKPSFLFLVVFGANITIGLQPLTAKAAGETAGLSLLRSPGARSSALGEAFTSVTDDVTAAAYNPSSLKSLRSSQASFLYEKGLADDAQARLQLGIPKTWGSIGFMVGTYDGGDFHHVDSQLNSRTITGQSDLLMAISYANSFHSLRWGITGKAFSSELLEQYKSTAYLADVGLQTSLTDKIDLGFSVQNLGTSLKYDRETVDVPQMIRFGSGFSLLQAPYTLKLLMDVPYSTEEGSFSPALGTELNMTLLAIRAGFRRRDGLQNNVFIGMGLILGQVSFDYAFGMVDEFENQNQISASLRFGPKSADSSIFRDAQPLKGSQPKATFSTPERKKPARKQPSSTVGQRLIYTVKPGDSLREIARKHYGDPEMWRMIFNVNRHLIDASGQLTPGQKIILP